MKKQDQAFIAYHPIYKLPLPEGHRFPMEKYELLPQQLLLEGVVTEDDFFEPGFLNKKYLEGVHDDAYLEKLFTLNLDRSEIRRIGFPLTQDLIDRELRLCQGSITGAEIALKRGIGFNIAGGTHHAGKSFGEGFCILNDQAVAAAYLLRERTFKKILIVDLDVHQGNGTADIFKNENRVFTFSMHGQNNFPFKKEVSNLDEGLPDGILGADYLEILEQHLSHLFREVEPEFIFYQAGVDVLDTDKMGKLKLSADDCRRRDQIVFQVCKQYHLPVQVSMGGGYSKQIRDIVNAHANTYKEGIAALLR